MAKLLAIFNILAGAASIIGVLIQLIAPSEQWPREILLPVCAVSGLFCLYVLFVPGSRVERNVRSKIARYSDRTTPDVHGNVLVQRGVVRFMGFGRKTIEFEEPFLETPEVEILDSFGDFRGDGGPPKLVSASPHAAIIERSGGTIFAAPRCAWVARGTPLHKIG